jgi:putative ABC transport system permease protein
MLCDNLADARGELVHRHAIHSYVEDLVSDLSQTLRQVRSSFGVALICTLVLAVGIGSAAAVFAVLYDAILKPLPYRDSNQLVYVHNEFRRVRLARTGVSGPDFADLTTQREIFSETGAYYFNDFTMAGTGYAQHVDAVNTSASIFPMLGLKPLLGRTFTEEEDIAGAKVVVLSYDLWRGTFGDDPNAIGRTIELDGAAYQVIGVMPADFDFPYRATQMWVPLSLPPLRYAASERGRKWLQMIARVAPGLTPQRANAALVEISRSYAATFHDAYPLKAGWHFSCEQMADQRTETIRGWLALAFAAVLCVLLVACINASGLLLVRTTVRQREWAVRAALGARPARLLRQVFTETGLLALAGCGAGMAFAAGAVRVINEFGPVRTAGIGPWTYLFALIVALGSTVVAGISPAASLLNLPLNESLKTGDSQIATSRTGWRNVLVAAQIAIAITLLFTATALAHSFVKLLRLPLGFSAERVWTGAIQLPERGETAALHSSQFFQNLVSRVSALPGVESASAGSIPFSPDGMWLSDLYFPGRPAPAVRPTAAINVVLPDYFKTLEIPLLEGRTFSVEDDTNGRTVAVVDRAFVQRYFRGRDPIGQLVANDATEDNPYTIVGVVGSVEDGLGKAPEPDIYLPEMQDGNSAMYLLVREATGQDITAAVRRELSELAPDVALFDVTTMSRRVSHSVRLRRLIASLLGSSALIGLLLAALGLYGTLAQLVELRRREFAIRVALGGSASDIRRLIARHSLLIASAGLLPGMFLALVAVRATRSFLFGVGSFDPWTITVTAVGFLALVLLASWIPALRATRVDVLVTLRDE